MREADAASGPLRGIVGPAVADRVGQAQQEAGIDGGLRVAKYDAGDPAHDAAF